MFRKRPIKKFESLKYFAGKQHERTIFKLTTDLITVAVIFPCVSHLASQNVRFKLISFPLIIS